jgi:hypothetical protein
MAQLVIEIPDEQLNRFENAIAARMGYGAATDGLPLQAFVAQQVARFAWGVVIAHERDQAEAAARAALQPIPD